MTCPGADIDECSNDVPCRACPATCPYCGDPWQVHVEPGNPCSTPRADPKNREDAA